MCSLHQQTLGVCCHTPCILHLLWGRLGDVWLWASVSISAGVVWKGFVILSLNQPKIYPDGKTDWLMRLSKSEIPVLFSFWIYLLVWVFEIPTICLSSWYAGLWRKILKSHSYFRALGNSPYLLQECILSQIVFYLSIHIETLFTHDFFLTKKTPNKTKKL